MRNHLRFYTDIQLECVVVSSTVRKRVNHLASQHTLTFLLTSCTMLLRMKSNVLDLLPRGFAFSLVVVYLPAPTNTTRCLVSRCACVCWMRISIFVFFCFVVFFSCVLLAQKPNSRNKRNLCAYGFCMKMNQLFCISIPFFFYYFFLYTQTH